MSRNKGFTLIELLVVIAIIAILAAILFPVFAQAREKAKQSTCLNNQKQIALALMQYAQENDESFPVIQYEVYVAAGNPGVAAIPANILDPDNIPGSGDEIVIDPGAPGIPGEPAYYKANPLLNTLGDPDGIPDSGDEKYGAGYGVFYPLAAYIKGPGVMRCPSRPPGADIIYGANAQSLPLGCPSGSGAWVNGAHHRLPGIWGSDNANPEALPQKTSSDWNNYWPTIAVGTYWNPTPGSKASMLKSASNVIATFESVQKLKQGTAMCYFVGNNFSARQPIVDPVSGAPTASAWYTRQPNHSGGMIFTFADGHAKWFDMKNHPGNYATDPTGIQYETARRAVPADPDGVPASGDEQTPEAAVAWALPDTTKLFPAIDLPASGLQMDAQTNDLNKLMTWPAKSISFYAQYEP